MRIAAILIVAAALVVIGVMVLTGTWSDVTRWAAEQQRLFQNDMAVTIRAIRTGDGAALAGLLVACAGYGVVHAIGPGHGKVLIGGASVATRATMWRMVALAIVSSLAQALTAIIAIYGGFLLLEVSARTIIGVTEDYMAPISFGLIALIGGVLVWRGFRQITRAERATSVAGCGHAHAPSVEQVNDMTSWRDMAALIFSIAIRPCTGAMFVLAIAWQMDLKLAGVLAAIAMGLGTAFFTTAVAVGGVGFRGAVSTAAAGNAILARGVPLLQIAGGCLVVLMGAVLFAGSV